MKFRLPIKSLPRYRDYDVMGEIILEGEPVEENLHTNGGCDCGKLKEIEEIEELEEGINGFGSAFDPVKGKLNEIIRKINQITS